MIELKDLLEDGEVIVQNAKEKIVHTEKRLEEYLKLMVG